MKAAVSVGAFTRTPQTVSRCFLALFVSFSIMQGCSEPVAFQHQQQGSVLIFLGGNLRNLVPLGAHGSFVAWAPNLIVFTCISMPVWSSVLAATEKAWVQGERSQKSPSQGAVFRHGSVQAKKLYGHVSSSCNKSSVPTLGEKTVWAAGEVAWLISCCCHPFLAPERAAVQGGPTHGCSLGNLEQAVSPQWEVMWHEEIPVTWPACPCSTA